MSVRAARGLAFPFSELQDDGQTVRAITAWPDYGGIGRLDDRCGLAKVIYSH
jgi:hypothetical protein